MEPYTIARRGAQYHDEELDSDYSSATAIRSLLAYSSSSFNTEPVEGNYDELRFREYCQSWKTRFQNVVWNF